MLLLFRVVQGIAIGGEAPGGWVFAAEHARGGQLGLTVALQTNGLCGGVLIGSLVAAGVSGAFSQGQIINGFWRIPFLLGGIFGIIGMSLRRWLSETPVFEEMRKRAEASRELPLRVVLRSHGRAVVASVMSFSMLMAGIMVVVLMGPALLQRLFQLSPRSVQSANLAATAALCVSTVAVGAATDRFGLRRVATPVLLLLIVATYGLYLSAARMQSALLPFSILAGIGLGAVALPPIIAVRAFPSLCAFHRGILLFQRCLCTFRRTYPVRLMACSSKSHEPSSLYRRYDSVVASSYSYGTERAFLKLTMAYA